MIRKVITIDSEKCNGCSLCADACHEGAIGMVDGKAVLLRDDYCDGLGNCLPVCPTGAISFEEREAAAFDQAAVEKHMAKRAGAQDKSQDKSRAEQDKTRAELEEIRAEQGSELRQWPVQIKLVPLKAPYFDQADLLIAADCAAYACCSFHSEFMRGRVTIIGCPKLDDTDYSEKLTEIIKQNDIRSLTVIRMEVPCCGGIEYAAMNALKNSGKRIPSQVVTISIQGDIL